MKASVLTFPVPRAPRAAEVCEPGKSAPWSTPNSDSPVMLRASWAGRQAAGWS